MKYLLLILTIFLLGCETTPNNPELWMEREVNACLPTAIVFKQSLKKYGVWSEVFRYSWRDAETGKIKGHAMVAYLYPPGKNQLFTYDAMGSYRTYAYTNNVQNIAQSAHTVRGASDKIFAASWIK
jgi:hypothetical protein